MSGGTVEAPGQPSRPSHQQHVDPQVLRANHTPSTETAGALLASSTSREWVWTFQGAQSPEEKGLCWTLESQEPRLCWDNSPADPGTHVQGRGLPHTSCSLPDLPKVYCYSCLHPIPKARASCSGIRETVTSIPMYFFFFLINIKNI